MPLIQSGSKKAIGDNIGELIRSGRPPDQAKAIAYGVARRRGGKVGVRRKKVGVRKK